MVYSNIESKITPSTQSDMPLELRLKIKLMLSNSPAVHCTYRGGGRAFACSFWAAFPELKVYSEASSTEKSTFQEQDLVHRWLAMTCPSQYWEPVFQLCKVQDERPLTCCIRYEKYNLYCCTNVAKIWLTCHCFKTNRLVQSLSKPKLNWILTAI